MNITVKTKQGDRTAVAYHSGVPGLVVSKTLDGRGWGITHRPSGYLVSGETLPNRADAIALAKRLANLTDWSRPADELAEAAGLNDMAELGEMVRKTIYPGIYGVGPVRESVVESFLPEGWILEGDDLDGLLVCPHGHTIEMDGRCHEGCISPLRTAGLI